MLNDKPKALDLFCKAGGATKGLQQAGFHVTGVDIEPQPRYCGDVFIQADAMTFDLSPYDFVWASPHCQRYSFCTPAAYKMNHPDQIPEIRKHLIASGKPYMIENVEGAKSHLINPIMLCGSMFGLKVWRHRFFESNYLPYLLLPPCDHSFEPVLVTGSPRRKRWNGTEFYIYRTEPTTAAIREAMEIDWMIKKELDAAIPPAYSRFLGEQIIESLKENMKLSSISNAA